ncbi:GNAT family N-acetyltransferase [Niveibacterium terrae]|uniref:GNAT family N-acetyltransferase n=1 Tax=Niveibacterium terrae TaxID=3373598 RepID=UPI003A8F098E
MDSMIRIDTARLDDAAAIAALSGELGYALSEEQARANLSRMLASPLQRIFVVRDEQAHALAWLGVERRCSLESGESCEISGLVVGSQARRRGVGRALIAAAAQWARAQGFAKLRVRSNAARSESHRFYQSLGFAPVKTQHVYDLELGTEAREG